MRFFETSFQAQSAQTAALGSTPVFAQLPAAPSAPSSSAPPASKL